MSPLDKAYPMPPNFQGSPAVENANGYHHRASAKEDNASQHDHEGVGTMKLAIQQNARAGQAHQDRDHDTGCRIGPIDLDQFSQQITTVHGVLWRRHGASGVDPRGMAVRAEIGDGSRNLFGMRFVE
jgi:hypothetical protein